MFEKEAEEWVKENLHNTEEDYKKAFKDGAEFGYSKANEWHDLRKDPDDLPKEMERDTKRYLKSKMNGYANKFCKRNKVDDSSSHLVIKAFKSAFMLSYKLFLNRDNFWEPRYWILNDIYVRAMESDEKYLAKLKKKENEELKTLIENMQRDVLSLIKDRMNDDVDQNIIEKLADKWGLKEND